MTKRATTVCVVACVVLGHAWIFSAILRAAAMFPSAPTSVQYIADAQASQVRLLGQVQNETIALAANAQWVDSLEKYAALPPAQIIVAKRQSTQKYSSFAYPKSAGQECLVQFTVDDYDQGAMVRSMMQLGGIRKNAPDKLRIRLNEYEALHELAHCLQAQNRYPVDAPGLTISENMAIARGFLASPASTSVGLYRELFADAYAMHRFLTHYRALDMHVQSQADMQLVRAWRIAYLQQTSPLARTHATAPMVVAILGEIEAFLSLPAEEAATRYASVYLVRWTLQTGPKNNPFSEPLVPDASKAWNRALALGTDFPPTQEASMPSIMGQPPRAQAMMQNGW